MKKRKISIAVMFVLIVFLVMLLSVVSAGMIAFVLNIIGFLDISNETNPYMPFLVMIYIGVFMGVVIAALVSRQSVKPIRDIMKATDKVAKGDFSIVVSGSPIFELDSLSNSFNKMVGELKGIETLRSDFVNNFSHEFKTPIISIKGFAKLLKESDLTDDERQEYLNIIISESERLAALSTNILNLSKIENTEIISEKTAYMLDEQVRLAIVMLEPKWSAKNLNIDISLEDNIQIIGDKNLLGQVWVNLLDNAVKYTDNGGTIKVSLWKGGHCVTFRLEDNGCGMNDEALRHMFDKFYQGDNSHAIAGNGLGLTLVRKIIELCGGSIEVQSRVGKGSVFLVTLLIKNEN